MGTFSLWHWLVVLVIILIIFGAGRLPEVMGDVAKGVKAFRAGLRDEDEKPAEGATPSPAATPTQTLPPSAMVAPGTAAGQTTVRTPPVA
ncbi:Sec-independent protein translocase protein TatA [uncultured Gammaproteobacteria bacterium]